MDWSDPSYEGTINHPKDDFIPELNVEPNKFHYQFTENMKAAIDNAVIAKSLARS